MFECDLVELELPADGDPDLTNLFRQGEFLWSGEFVDPTSPPWADFGALAADDLQDVTQRPAKGALGRSMRRTLRNVLHGWWSRLSESNRRPIHYE
jgi:hypothetical protein